MRSTLRQSTVLNRINALIAFCVLLICGQRASADKGLLNMVVTSSNIRINYVDNFGNNNFQDSGIQLLLHMRI
jgi:hypothetical protein